MGTKNEPGEYDCHGRAHPDEPYFELLGRDRTAHHLVLIWTTLRTGHWEFAEQHLKDAIAELRAIGRVDPLDEQIMEAYRCSDEMRAWSERVSVARTAAGRSVPTAAAPTLRSESTATPNAGIAAA